MTPCGRVIVILLIRKETLSSALANLWTAREASRLCRKDPGAHIFLLSATDGPNVHVFDRNHKTELHRFPQILRAWSSGSHSPQSTSAQMCLAETVAPYGVS